MKSKILWKAKQSQKIHLIYLDMKSFYFQNINLK